MKEYANMSNEELFQALEQEVKTNIPEELFDRYQIIEDEILLRITIDKKEDLINIDNYSMLSNKQLLQLLSEEIVFTQMEGVVTNEYQLIRKEILSRMP